MDTTTDHFTPLALRVRGNELHTPASNSDSDDSAADNLDCLINILREKDNSEKDNLVQTVSQLCYSFVEDVCKRTKQMDTQYLLGLQKFFYYLFGHCLRH